ncbi:MAG: hypothetical protein Q8J69_04085 [Sphingobacteriaceae bacterium]|nr:hypothetical protein [Sphingobacteriaceae bacterium]
MCIQLCQLSVDPTIISTLIVVITTALLFYLKIRSDIRNYFTNEFKVVIKLDGRSKDHFNLYVKCESTSQELFIINQIKIKISDTIRSNPAPSSPIVEQLFACGWWHLTNSKFDFTQSYSESFTISDSSIINAINNGDLNKIQVFVVSSKYGTTKSNKLKLKPAMDFQKDLH